MGQPDTDLNETLERLIDDEGLLNVMVAVAEVCRAKAEHIRTNWGDKALAKRWDAAAKRLEGMQTVLSATAKPKDP